MSYSIAFDVIIQTLLTAETYILLVRPKIIFPRTLRTIMHLRSVKPSKLRISSNQKNRLIKTLWISTAYLNEANVYDRMGSVVSYNSRFCILSYLHNADGVLPHTPGRLIWVQCSCYPRCLAQLMTYLTSFELDKLLFCTQSSPISHQPLTFLGPFYKGCGL